MIAQYSNAVPVQKLSVLPFDETGVAWTIYVIVSISCDSILVLLFGYTLVMNCVKGSDSKFARNVTACLFVFNLASLMRMGVGRLILDPIKDNDENALIGFWPMFAGVAYSLLISVELVAFNNGNWYFAFHYFRCSSEIKFLT